MRPILVAEDEPLARWSVSEFLRREGFDVAEAHDGETAMELIDRNPFEIVISDYALAGKVNGIDVLRHYQKRRPDRLKVLITGQDGDPLAAAQEMGCVYLRKPVFLEDLLAIVNSRTLSV